MGSEKSIRNKNGVYHYAGRPKPINDHKLDLGCEIGTYKPGNQVGEGKRERFWTGGKDIPKSLPHHPLSPTQASPDHPLSYGFLSTPPSRRRP